MNKIKRIGLYIESLCIIFGYTLKYIYYIYYIEISTGYSNSIKYISANWWLFINLFYNSDF